MRYRVFVEDRDEMKLSSIFKERKEREEEEEVPTCIV